jgi:hypothetical protein
LVAVGFEEETASAQPRAAEGGAAASRFRVVLPGALLLLLVVAVVLLVVQTRRTAALEGRVSRLQFELQVAEDRLEAYQAHLATVRDGVAGVRAELLALEELVAQEPAPGGSHAPGAP